MKRGKVYRYEDNSKSHLTSGASYYPYAVCVSVEPFVLVSESGDMLWSNSIKATASDFEEVDIVIDTSKSFKRYYGNTYLCIVIEEEN